MTTELHSILRFQQKSLSDEMYRREISVLLGPRQVGKTYLMKQLQQKVEAEGRKSVFFNLENPFDLQQFNQSDADLIQMLAHSGWDIIFIDEFHYLKNASKLFKVIVDDFPHIKIVASGSSSIEMHKHLKESLAGRLLRTHIGPLRFDEFCQKYQINGSSAPIYTKELPQILEEYLCFGGLPGLLKESDPEQKKRLLDEMVQTYILKDIKALIKEENIRAYSHLMYLLAQNQGQIVSVNSLANEVGLSSPTIENYLNILDATYVLKPLHSYATNIGNELKKSRKFYLYDLGIRNALLKNFASLSNRDDVGAMHESFVHQQLLRRMTVGQELKFWRNRQGQEIDFVLLENQRPCCIEVKTSANQFPKAFSVFFSHYPKCTHGVIYTGNPKSPATSQSQGPSVIYRDITDIGFFSPQLTILEAPFNPIWEILDLKKSFGDALEALKQRRSRTSWLKIFIPDWEQYCSGLKLPLSEKYISAFLLAEARDNLLSLIDMLGQLPPPSQLTQDYKSRLAETWFYPQYSKEEKWNRSKHWLAAFIELIYAAHLSSEGQEIMSLAATGGPFDIETKSAQIEVKYLDFEEEFLKSVENGGSGTLDMPALQAYWTLRMSEAVLQLKKKAPKNPEIHLIFVGPEYTNFKLVKFPAETGIPVLSEIFENWTNAANALEISPQRLKMLPLLKKFKEKCLQSGYNDLFTQTPAELESIKFRAMGLHGNWRFFAK